MEKQKVLFFAANPKETKLLQLDEEVRAITQKIRGAEYRDTLILYSMWATRPDDLLQHLNEHKPQIVHFSGHGSHSGEILLVDDSGNPKFISAEAIRALFTTLKDNIRLVVLNTCYSQVQAQAIAEVIDCVIGMNKAVGDEAAIIFAASFYRAIGFGRSIKEASEQGKVALLLEGIPEENTPELLHKNGVDPAQIFLVTNHSLTASSTLSGPVVDFHRNIEALSNIQKRFLLEIARSGNIYVGGLRLKLNVSRRETVYIVRDLEAKGLVDIEHLTDYLYRLSEPFITFVENTKKPSFIWIEVQNLRERRESL